MVCVHKIRGGLRLCKLRSPVVTEMVVSPRGKAGLTSEYLRCVSWALCNVLLVVNECVCLCERGSVCVCVCVCVLSLFCVVCVWVCVWTIPCRLHRGVESQHRVSRALAQPCVGGLLSAVNYFGADRSRIHPTIER